MVNNNVKFCSFLKPDKNNPKYTICLNPKAVYEQIVDWEHECQRCEFNPVNQAKERLAFKKSKEMQAQDEGYLFDSFHQYSNYLVLADQFIEQQPIYYDNMKIWWLWNHKDKCWKPVDEIDILNRIDDNTKFPTVNSTVKNEWLEALKRTGRKNAPKPIEKTWVQLKDKIYDVEYGNVFPATPDHFVTNPLPHEVSDSEDTPFLDKIFAEWIGENNKQLLYEIIAFCMLPDYTLHRIFCLIGAGSNGKSCFLDVVHNFIGQDNVTATELESIITSRFEPARLYKKLVCFMGETDFDTMKKTSMLKKLTGGKDLINYERKNKEPFTDINYAKVLIATNNLPTTTDKTDGFYRRWLIIDFKNKFSEKVDIISQIPKEEYNNLATKSIRILKELLVKREFHNEGTVEDRRNRYEFKSNPIDKFIEEYVIISEDNEAHITKAQFKKKLGEFCKDNGFRELTEIAINKFMATKDIKEGRTTMEWFQDGYKKTVTPRTWRGIEWK